MNRRLIALSVFVTLVIVGSIGYYIYEQIVIKQQSEIENNSRNDYIRQAREQDSLRIAHLQDSLKKAEQYAVAHKEREERLRKQAEQEAIERKQQEEANRQNEILAQKKRIQEKEYRDNLVEEIDSLYTRVGKPTGGGRLALKRDVIASKKNKQILEDLISRVNSDTLWMNEVTRMKYRSLKRTYTRYWYIEKSLEELKDSAPTFGLG